MFQKFKDALNAGESALRKPPWSSPSGWRVNAWVKKGISWEFAWGSIVEMGHTYSAAVLDKSTYPVKTYI